MGLALGYSRQTWHSSMSRTDSRGVSSACDCGMIGGDDGSKMRIKITLRFDLRGKLHMCNVNELTEIGILILFDSSIVKRNGMGRFTN